MPGGNGIEKQLLLQVAEGDELAYRQIYDHYKAPFYTTAFDMTRSDAVAQDIVQEVFIALWKKRTYLSTSPNPVGYLMTMLHHAIYYHFRKLSRERQMKDKLMEDDLLVVNTIEESFLAKEQQELIQTIIKSLPPQQQLVYNLSREQGLSRTEIAEKLQLSPNTVKAHLSAALSTIKKQLSAGVSVLIWATIQQNV